MSEQPPTRHEHGAPQEEDLLPGGLILKVLGAVTLMGIAFGLWSWWLLDGYQARLRPSGRWPERELPAPTEQSSLEQELFREPAHAAPLRRAQQEQLRSFGWADRERGLVRIPIEDAMRLYLERRGGSR